MVQSELRSSLTGRTEHLFALVFVEFLTIRYHVKDIALKELTPAFISDFEMFLRTDKHCCTNTSLIRFTSRMNHLWH